MWRVSPITSHYEHSWGDNIVVTGIIIRLSQSFALQLLTALENPACTTAMPAWCEWRTTAFWTVAPQSAEWWCDATNNLLLYLCRYNCRRPSALISGSWIPAMSWAHGPRRWQISSVSCLTVSLARSFRNTSLTITGGVVALLLGRRTCDLCVFSTLT